MPDNKTPQNQPQEQKQPLKIEVAPRRLSLTQRLIGANREWLQSYYTSQEEDDQQFGQGFNDPTDDFVPGVIANSRRRRNSSTSSDASLDSTPSTGERVRSGSITERVAGMQLNRKPKTLLESYAITVANVVDDQT